MRIDSHHSFSERYPLDYLGSILKRNRFEKSILVGPPQPTPDYVAGIIAPIDSFSTPDPSIRGVQVRELPRRPESGASRPPDRPPEPAPAGPDIARAVPDRPLIVDHLGFPPPATWQRDIERRRRIPERLLQAERPDDVQRAPPVRPARALSLRPRRLMFGSDWPNGLPQYTWKTALAVFTQAIGAAADRGPRAVARRDSRPRLPARRAGG